MFGIYKPDERYNNSPWTIIDPSNDQKYKGIILLHFLQGENPNGTGHYSGMKLFNQHNLGSITFNSFKNKKITNDFGNEDIQMMNKNELIILIMNCRSIRDTYKKLLLIYLLKSKDIDIALLQETYLIENGKLYIKGYKVYRGDNTIRRKGVAILVK